MVLEGERVCDDSDWPVNLCSRLANRKRLINSKPASIGGHLGIVRRVIARAGSWASPPCWPA
jgi:hypothetical protein